MVTRKSTQKSEFVEILVSVNSLHFDPDNPRRDHMDDEVEIRRVLCEDEGVKKLAEHLARYGQNPLNRIALIAHPKLPKHYIVPEGNRRLCALQLLRDPSRAPTAAARRFFENLKATGRSVPDKVPAVLFHDNETARVWKSVHHEGEQGGIGTVQWGTREKTRHNRQGATDSTRPKNPNRQADSLVQYALKAGLISQEQSDNIKLTTLTRYLPNVRGALALLNSEDCTTNAAQDQFNTGIRRFLLDAIPTRKPAPPAPVNSRSDSSQRDAYAEQMRQTGVAPTDRSHPPFDPAQVTTRQQAAAARGEAAGNTRGATHPDKRRYLIPSSFVLKHHEPVLQRMVKEGKQLDPDQARFSCNYLNRAIIERAVFLYATKHCGGGQGDFVTVVQTVLTHASKSTDPPSRAVNGVLKRLQDQRTAYSYKQLGNGVHGGYVPSPKDNKSNWESLQPAIEYLLRKL